MLWIRCCQAIAYQDEVLALKLKQIQKTKLPRLRQLQLYLDNRDARSATIRTNSGRTTRAIVKLYPLEFNEEELPNKADETNEVDTRRTVPMQKAAMRAKENILKPGQFLRH
ncbi:Hypothetical predicted protein [Mytilus galloprovincialis]|uniref:Uncharacterized protein n=1 Tax=Mytilus galloprovincialis TaxID=29158 RepID=A0A8B6EGK8_MYTGA|nr:Hypothetical predicted protein [Mytilus galloprovincialis]